MEIIYLFIVSFFICFGKYIDLKIKGCWGIIIENLVCLKMVIIIIL